MGRYKVDTNDIKKAREANRSKKKEASAQKEESLPLANKNIELESSKIFKETTKQEEKTPKGAKSLLTLITEQKPTTPRMTRAISISISKKSDPFLFDSLPTDIQAEWEKAGFVLSKAEGGELSFRDIKGKLLTLSSPQMRLIHALSYHITQQLNEPDIIEHQRRVINNFLTGGRKDLDSMEIERNIKVEELAYFIYGRADEASIRAVGEDLINLSEARAQVLSIEAKDSEGRSRKGFSTLPFITIGKQNFVTIEQLKQGKKDQRGRRRSDTSKASQIRKKEGEKSILVSCSIRFHPIFFLNLEKAYCVIKPTLFPIWRKFGKSELFGIVLNLLQGMYGQKVIDYKNTPRKEKKKEENLRLSEEDFRNEIIKKQEASLTYYESLASIDSRLPNPYKDRKSRFKDNLTKVITGLKEYGIITEGHIVGEGVYFKINPKFSGKELEEKPFTLSPIKKTEEE